MKALQELRSKMTRKEIKTLRDSLGKQGISWEHHLHAMQSENDCKILQLDCFSLKQDSEHDSGVPDANGWYVGFGVQYNGVGVAGAGETSSESEDAEDVADEDDEESSGFDSDPTTETDDDVAGDPSRFGSDDDSDKGQIMYGLDEEFYVTRGLKPVTVRLQDTGIDQNFTPGEFVTTARFEVESRRHTDNEEDDDAKNEYADYQALGDVDQGDVFVVTHSEDPEEPLDTNTISSGLWCNFVIAPVGLEPPKKLEISAEKLKTIPLDDEKLAQISAAMADFKLPTPPGWEGVSDKKLLDFINSRV